jgi:hypothetical protein
MLRGSSDSIYSNNQKCKRFIARRTHKRLFPFFHCTLRKQLAIYILIFFQYFSIYVKGFSIEEKRQLKRRELIYNLKVFERESGEHLGWVVDIHAEALKLTGSRFFEKGSQLSAFVELPAEILGKTSIEFTAEVLWC